MRDQLSNLQIKRAIDPVVITDNTASVSQIIDMQGYNSCTFLISTGTLADADATFAVLLEEGNVSNLSDNATVADADMISQTQGTAPLTAAAFTFAADNQVRAVGYVGAKRYVRLTITPTNNTGNAPLQAIAALGRPQNAPVAHATA